MKKEPLAGRHYVIAGATSGVGSSSALRLLEEGASLLLMGRNTEKLAKLALNFPGERVWCAPLDLESANIEENMKISFEQYMERRGVEGFDGGIYCAGQSPLLALRGTTQKSIESLFRINYTGAIIFSKLVTSKHFRHTSKGSSVVLIASVCANKGEVGLSLYGGSKAALVATVKALGREIAPFGSRINCISPGWLDTEMNRKSEVLVPDLAEKMKQLHPLGLGSAEDVASAIIFLLSDEARWITGTNLTVDGGFLA